jgi:cobalt-zinc-cadmium efflux system protein
MMGSGHHHHHHGHHHGVEARQPGELNRAFALGVGLNLAFVVVEALAGWWAGSLALLADAGHNLSDVVGLLLAWGAIVLAARRPTARRTYGFRRGTIFAALLSSLLLLMALGAMGWEALRRLADPPPVHGGTVIMVAAAGVVVNTLTALLFLKGRHQDLNLKGAFLHMAADAAISAGVVLGGALILWTGWLWIDPLLSLGIAAVILIGTWSLLRDSTHLAMDAVPAHIDPAQVEAWFLAQPEVTGLHDLHIWALSTTEVALTVHLRVSGTTDDAFLRRLARELEPRFGIHHPTLQLERGDGPEECPQAVAGSL